MSVGGWLESLEEEAHDHYGALSIPLGLAFIVGCILLAWLTEIRWVAWLFFGVLIIAALWVGNERERAQLRDLGRRRTRETLLLRSTWLPLVWCALLSYGPVALADARGWSNLEGWVDGALYLLVLVATYHLALGLLAHILRWTILGAALALMAVAIPAVPALRRIMWVAVGLAAGGGLLISGYRGRQALLRRLAASSAKTRSPRTPIE